ncbi:MAG TPA: cell division protein FtsZ [Rhodospirillaceae bacterium]|nr:cell division protein FtsZ [Rhodospirillaceae bacterium]
MINLSMAEPDNMLRPRITVVGVGGGGCNAINNMISSNLEGCDFVAANTDAQALALSLAARKIQLGTNLSRGLGAGSKPEVGCAAAEETMADIMSVLEGSDMLFVTAGMGGGTGTGAAPVIARAAREIGILTVGVVTKPFHFEGTHRMRQAESGIAELQKYVDTLIVIPNQNLFRIANERTTFAEAFRLADEVLHSGVRGITDLMVMPGFMNLDFADVKTVMGEMGKAMMGTGEAEGDNRAICAAEAAISNPLLDDISMKGARGVLINITGGLDMTLFEVDQAANRIREEVDSDAQTKVGSTLGEGLDGRIRVSVIATGIENSEEGQSGKNKPSTEPVSMGCTPAVEKPAIRVLETAQRKSSVTSAPLKTNPVTPSAKATLQAPKTANVSTSYFSMPASATPKAMGTKQASPVTMSAQAEKYASQAQDVAPFEEEPQMQEPQEEEFVVQEATPPSRVVPQSSRATAVPPVREIQPTVQQAQRQRTASAGARVEPKPVDMRVTQLTTASPQQAASKPTSSRSQSLFQRITGFGLIRPSVQEEEEDVGEEIDREAEAAVQSSLGVDPTDRPVLSGSDADLLDIPAFLRRQSNH